MVQPEFTIARRQTSAIIRIKWAWSAWLRVEPDQRSHNFTKGLWIL
jgi:hypothetical protein